MTAISFYLDENLDPVIAEQLRQSGIDALAVRDLEALGDSDVNHLERATEMGRVLCTHDQDFLRMNAQGMKHAGIVFGQQYQATIGGWVKALTNLHETTTAEEMVGQVKFLPVQ